MKLTWRQFQCYQEAFSWLLNEQSDKGKQENYIFDLEFTKGDDRLKDLKKQEIEKANAALSKMREQMRKRALQ